MILLMFVLLFGLLFSGFPIFIALLLATVVPIVVQGSLPLEIVGQRVFSGMDKFSLLAVPLFILSANVMLKGGLSSRIVRFAEVMTAHLKGGVAITSIVSCLLFGAVSGSSPATVVAIGGLMIPALNKNGYPSSFSTGLLTSCSAIALIIPPSITMILYGVVTGVSVGDLFIAGVIPGILFGAVFAIYSYWFSGHKNIAVHRKATSAERKEAFKDASWALGAPLLIIGGIYSGVFTPTEAAAIACLYAVFATWFIYKELTLKLLFEAASDAAINTALIMILIGAAAAFSFFLTIEQVPQSLVHILLSMSESKIVILLLINVLLLIGGMFVDPASLILILAPLLLPIAKQLGVDPLHLGIIFIANTAIGMFTPPFGFNLFVASSITKRSVASISIGLLPFIAISLIVLSVITFVPAISTLLVGK